MQIESQELMTKDNVTIKVDAVAFYKVEDPLKALCNIADRDAAVNEAAQVFASLMALRSLALFVFLFLDQEILIDKPATDLSARSTLACSVRRSITRPR